MKKIKLLTTISSLGVLTAAVPVVATSCSKTTNVSFAPINSITTLDASVNAEPGKPIVGTLINGTQPVSLIPNSVTVTWNNNKVFAYGYSQDQMGVSIIGIYAWALTSDIIPENQDTVQVDITIKALTTSNQQVTATVPVTFAKSYYRVKMFQGTGMLSSETNYITFLNDGRIQDSDVTLNLKYYNFATSITPASTPSITITPESAAEGKITATKDEANNRITFHCDKECKPGYYDFAIETEMTPTGSSEAIKLSTNFTVYVEEIIPYPAALVTSVGGNFIMTKSGEKITVNTSSSLSFITFSDNMTYIQKAMTANFYAFKTNHTDIVEWDTASLQNNDYLLKLKQALTEEVEIEVTLTDKATENENYGTIKFTLVPPKE